MIITGKYNSFTFNFYQTLNKLYILNNSHKLLTVFFQSFQINQPKQQTFPFYFPRRETEQANERAWVQQKKIGITGEGVKEKRVGVWGKRIVSFAPPRPPPSCSLFFRTRSKFRSLCVHLDERLLHRFSSYLFITLYSPRPQSKGMH